LKGWADQVNDEVEEYYETLGEIYDKWFKSGNPIPPEIKLGFMLCMSAGKYHMAQSGLSTIPNLQSFMSNNPELANHLSSKPATHKVQEQYTKQKELYKEKLDQNHELARQQAADLQMLHEKKNELLKQQQAQQQQHQLIHQQTIQQQFLQQQASQQQQMQKQIMDKQKQLENLQAQLDMQRSDTRSFNTNISSLKNQQQMSRPVIPDSIRNRFSLRTQPKDTISIDENIDNIIRNTFDDNKSVISDDKNSRDSRRSRESRGSRGSSKRKTIKINT
jgi:hypothetical protein